MGKEVNKTDDGYSSFNGTFGIEDTMEFMGNQELLNDLLSPESVTSDSSEVIAIDDKTDKNKKLEAEKETVVKTDSEEEKGRNIETFLGEEEGNEEKGLEKSEKTEKQKVNTEEDVDEVNQFTALSKDLFKLGVFSMSEEEEEPNIDTAEAFLERFNDEKKKGAIEIVNNFIGQFGDDYQRAFDAIYVKGVNPKEYFGTYNEIVDLSSLDLSKEENQIIVVRRALADQGMEDKYIEDEIETRRNYGDLEKVATNYHKVLMKREAAKLQEKERKAEEDMQRIASIKNQYVRNVQTILQDKVKTKEFDGIPINPALAAELQDFLLVDKYKTTSGELLTDFDKAILDLKKPENHELKVKVALLLKVLEKDPSLSTIQKSAISKKTNTLFEEVTKTAGNRKENFSQDKRSSWFK